MKILASLAGTDSGRSGLGTYAKEVLPRMARLLESRGGRLVVAGTPDDHAAYASLGRCERIELAPALAHPLASAVWHAFGFGALAERHGADAVLLPAGNRRVSLDTRVPTVTVVHDLAMLKVAGKYDVLRTAYARWLVAAGIRRSTVVAAISRSTREEIASFASDRDDVRVIPNGVDTTRFVPAPGPSPYPRPYVLYPARLEHPGKNHLGLLEAFARSRVKLSHDLVFAGDDWGGRSIIEARITALGLERRVKILGRVSDDELVARVAHASAVAMVGFGEGFGLPALEALASGVPVVAAEAGALPEVVGPLGERCNPHDPASIADALDRVVRPASRLRARVDGPAWARRFTWDRTASALVRACVDAAHAAGRAPQLPVFQPALLARAS